MARDKLRRMYPETPGTGKETGTAQAQAQEQTRLVELLR